MKTMFQPTANSSNTNCLDRRVHPNSMSMDLFITLNLNYLAVIFLAKDFAYLWQNQSWITKYANSAHEPCSGRCTSVQSLCP